MVIKIDVSFPGNLRVDAKTRGFVISTDQPESTGRRETAARHALSSSPLLLQRAPVFRCKSLPDQKYRNNRHEPENELRVGKQIISK